MTSKPDQCLQTRLDVPPVGQREEQHLLRLVEEQAEPVREPLSSEPLRDQPLAVLERVDRLLERVQTRLIPAGKHVVDLPVPRESNSYEVQRGRRVLDELLLHAVADEREEMHRFAHVLHHPLRKRPNSGIPEKPRAYLQSQSRLSGRSERPV